MGKRVKQIRALQYASVNILINAKKILSISKTISDKELRTILLAIVAHIGRMMVNLSIYLMTIIPKSYRKDEVDKKFEKLIKPLERELKKRGKK